ncbi:MAG: 1-deoxy-D-xylulose-5-phosphate synthase [Actinomycetota bacterium]|nr:1-deoxy-D-xylulose-5-phosphate synthase [Actinomycetota bacterium]
MIQLAEADDRVMLLTGDLGFMVVEPFADRFPDRFYNVGVAEQNMVGVATGLAEAGFIPYTYSIATFAALRPYEFIRNGPVHHQLPVRVVGVGGGFAYGTAGHTHHSLEDVAVMRAQPAISVVAPADSEQTVTAMRATWDLPGPLYLRLGKDSGSAIPGLDGRFGLGRAERVREGRDLVMVAMGPVAATAVAAAGSLAEHGVECAVVVVASLSPPPVQDLVHALTGCTVALTIEAHSVVGGVGSLVCEVVAEAGLGCRVVRCGVRSPPGDGLLGDEAYLLAAHGISRESLVSAACTALG